MASVARSPSLSAPAVAPQRCCLSALTSLPARCIGPLGHAAASRAAPTCHASASASGPAPSVHASVSTPQPAALVTPRPQSPAVPAPLSPTLRSLLLSAAFSLPCTLLAAAACSAAELSAAAAAAAPAPASASAAAALTFEPRAPDAGVLAAQVLVLLLTAGAGAYWWYVVVPTERAAVGRSKRLGALNNYLGELEAPQATQERKLERWFYTDWLQQREKRRQRLGKPAASAAAAASAASPAAASPTATPADASAGGAPSPEDPYTGEHVPYSDDLLRPTVETPTPRFLSLDNPLVATAALLTLVGVVSTLLHG